MGRVGAEKIGGADAVSKRPRVRNSKKGSGSGQKEGLGKRTCTSTVMPYPGRGRTPTVTRSSRAVVNTTAPVYYRTRGGDGGEGRW